MPPKEITEKGWSDKEKLVFYVSLIESGAVAIDWTKAILPPGKTRNAVTKMMKRTKDQLKPELDALMAGDGGNTTTNKKARSKTPKVTDTEEGGVKEEKISDDEKPKTKRSRTKASASDETRGKKQKV